MSDEKAVEAVLVQDSVSIAVDEVAQEVEAVDEISALLKAHEGDPDWSAEELEKAKNDPHATFDPNGKKSPGEFNRSSPLFTKIKETTKELARLKKQMDDMNAKLSESEKRGYQRALAELEVKRREAVKFGDEESFEAYDKQYRELQQVATAAPAQVASVRTIPEGAEEFFERNNHWLTGETPEDERIRDKVTAYEQRLLERRFNEGKPTLSPKALGIYLEDYAKAEFPHRFQNPAQAKPVAVEAADSPRVKPSEPKVTYDDLNAFQQAACDRFVKQNPGATKAEYIKLLKNAASPAVFE